MLHLEQVRSYGTEKIKLTDGDYTTTQSRRAVLYLLLQPLQHGSQKGLSVFFIDLHLLLQLLLGVLDEVVVLFKSLLDHLTLVFPLLSQVLQQFSLLTLGGERGSSRNYLNFRRLNSCLVVLVNAFVTSKTEY